MDDTQAKALLDKIVGQIFGLQNPYSLDQFAAKFAFDIRIPSMVTDSWTNEDTWAQSTQGTKFVKFKNLIDNNDTSMIDRRPVESIEDIMQIWQEVTLTSAERYLDSVNVSKSDAIYRSQDIYKCTNIHDSKNIAFSDTIQKSEFVAASQRSDSSVFSMRIDDCAKVSNSFQVTWSNNISNCLFIKDCSDMSDSMFCSQVTGKRFCIANMQFEEAEYRKWEKLIKQWVLTN